MLLYLSTTGSDDNLTLTTNQTAVCLGDCYYLFCANHKPLADCGANDVIWFSSSSTEMITNDSTHMMSTENATLMVLKILITEDEFHEPQTFFCKAITCMSNVVSVGRYGEFKSGTHVYDIGLYLVQQAMHEVPLYTTHGLMLHAVKSYNEYCVCM